MRLIQKSTISQDQLIFNFLPAKLCKNRSGWIIEYYAENIVTQDLIRVRKRVDHIKKRFRTIKEAETHCNKIVLDININLAKGINPLYEADTKNNFITIPDFVAKFLKEKTKELREDTMRSYNSFSKIFLSFTKEKKIQLLYKFTAREATQYMDYIYNVREVSNRSYNNYLKFMRCLFNYAIEKSYIMNNPFTKLKTKTKEKKQRTLVDAEARQKITQYLNNNSQFLIITKLMYNCLIRPKEIRNLRISDINLKQKTITVRDEIAKNHKTRIIPITTDIDSSLQYIINHKSTYYVFSNKELKPGTEIAHKDKFSKIWVKMIKELKLPSTMQLYSLRDTGIFDMIKAGIDPLTVKQLADHHSLEMTTIYSNHADPNLAAIIQEKAPKF